MLTMVDEIYDRHYQNARSELNAGVIGALGALSKTLSDSFSALHRIEWNAPWHHSEQHRRPN